MHTSTASARQEVDRSTPMFANDVSEGRPTGLLASGAGHELAEEVGVPVVPRVLRDHVGTGSIAG